MPTICRSAWLLVALALSGCSGFGEGPSLYADRIAKLEAASDAARERERDAERQLDRAMANLKAGSGSREEVDRALLEARDAARESRAAYEGLAREERQKPTGPLGGEPWYVAVAALAASVFLGSAGSNGVRGIYRIVQSAKRGAPAA